MEIHINTGKLLSYILSTSGRLYKVYEGAPTPGMPFDDAFIVATADGDRFVTWMAGLFQGINPETKADLVHLIDGAEKDTNEEDLPPVFEPNDILFQCAIPFDSMQHLLSDLPPAGRGILNFCCEEVYVGDAVLYGPEIEEPFHIAEML